MLSGWPSLTTQDKAQAEAEEARAKVAMEEALAQTKVAEQEAMQAAKEAVSAHMLHCVCLLSPQLYLHNKQLSHRQQGHNRCKIRDTSAAAACCAWLAVVVATSFFQQKQESLRLTRHLHMPHTTPSKKN